MTPSIIGTFFASAMSKRKQSKVNGPRSDDGDSDTGSEASLVNVDFDFFDPNPKVDFHALKRLLAQLFHSDADSFHLNELAELILSQPLVGTTIKTDGIEGDPLAYLTVLNMHVHQDHPSIKSITQYVLQKSTSNPSLHATLQALLGSQSQSANPNPNQVAFVFSERLVNMPVQVVPPMYRMLADEIQWAVDDNEPYKFTHFLFLTRTYRLTPQQAVELEQNRQEQSRPAKKRKNKGTPARVSEVENGSGGGNGGLLTYSFHPEDEYIQKYATHTHDYALSTSPGSSSGETRKETEDAFGLDVAGRMMLVPAERFPSLVQEMSTAYAVSGAGAVP